MRKEFEGILLVNTRERFCEVGLFAATETESRDLILRRVLSLGSLWNLENDLQIPDDVCLAIMPDGYEARSSAGFVKVNAGFHPTPYWRRVAATLEHHDGRLKTAIRGFEILLIPGGRIFVPQKKAIKHNSNVANLGKEFLSGQEYPEKIHIMEGQSNTFQRAEVWPGKNSCEPAFKLEHNEKFKNLRCVDWIFTPAHQHHIVWVRGDDPVDTALKQLRYVYHYFVDYRTKASRGQKDAAAIAWLALLAVGSEKTKNETGVNISPELAENYVRVCIASGWRLEVDTEMDVWNPEGEQIYVPIVVYDEPSDVKEKLCRLIASARELSTA